MYALPGYISASSTETPSTHLDNLDDLLLTLLLLVCCAVQRLRIVCLLAPRRRVRSDGASDSLEDVADACFPRLKPRLKRLPLLGLEAPRRRADDRDRVAGLVQAGSEQLGSDGCVRSCQLVLRYPAMPDVAILTGNDP